MQFKHNLYNISLLLIILKKEVSQSLLIFKLVFMGSKSVRRTNEKNKGGRRLLSELINIIKTRRRSRTLENHTQNTKSVNLSHLLYKAHCISWVYISLYFIHGQYYTTIDRQKCNTLNIHTIIYTNIRKIVICKICFIKSQYSTSTVSEILQYEIQL